MKIYKNRLFANFVDKHNISDADLCGAIERAGSGLIDANLGGGVIKQRIARPNEGKSGGFCTIVFFRVEERAFFVFGFAKNQRDNIGKRELTVFKILAKEFLAYTPEQMEAAVEAGTFSEVNCDEEDIPK